MNIRGIIIALGDTRIVLQHDGYQIERLWHEHSNAEGLDGWIADAMSDADTLAVLRKAGVMIGDLVHKLGDVADAEPVATPTEEIYLRHTEYWRRWENGETVIDGRLSSGYVIADTPDGISGMRHYRCVCAACVAERAKEPVEWTAQQIIDHEG